MDSNIPMKRTEVWCLLHKYGAELAVNAGKFSENLGVKKNVKNL